MKNSPSYYMQLKKPVLAIMKGYETDFTKHDRRDLKSMKGACIHVTRELGTTMHLESDFKKAASLAPDEYHRYLFGHVKGSEFLKHHYEQELNVFDSCHRRDNKMIMLCENGIIKSITIEQCIEKIKQWYREAQFENHWKN